MCSHTKRVLIVEDGEITAPLLRREVEELGEKLGYPAVVLTAGSFEEVDALVKRIEEGCEPAPDCALLKMRIFRFSKEHSTPGELHNPHRHWGVQSLERLLEVMPLEKILILSGWPDQARRALGSRPCPKVLMKPVRHETLMEEVGRLLGLQADV